MPRAKGPDRAPFSTTMPPELQEELRAVSVTSGVPVNRLVEDAVRALLRERYGREV